eukprot:487850-Pelagomonas_calceolata.AAC.8
MVAMVVLGALAGSFSDSAVPGPVPGWLHGLCLDGCNGCSGPSTPAGFATHMLHRVTVGSFLDACYLVATTSKQNSSWTSHPGQPRQSCDVQLGLTVCVHVCPNTCAVCGLQSEGYAGGAKDQAWKV